MKTAETTPETITMVNGNGKEYTTELPLIIIAAQFNDTAIKRIKENTGLEFKPHYMGMQAQPETSKQVLSLMMTYNFKSRYYNNWNHRNTLVLKYDNHVGFNVDSICYSCCKENNIPTGNMEPKDRMSC